MASEAPVYDLIVVGGGITGAGIARDAALRGLQVALFDKNDWGSGTSSKSSKMIHGGLRYLEHGEVGLVFESVSERAVQMRVAPHLVRPQSFFVPIFRDMKPGLEMINLGLWIYDTLALFRAPKLHKTFRGDRAARLVPELRRDGLKGAIEYWDCVTDDARLVLENVIDARALGAECHSHTEVIRFERNGNGRVRSVVTRDRFTGAEATWRCRAVIIAAGPWTDELLGGAGLGGDRPLLRRTKGVHLVIPHEKLPLTRAITLISPKDGRVMFAIPWRRRTVIGTTDTDFDGTADDVHADADDARYLCDSANAYFPGATLAPGDIIATWAGLRPLINQEGVSDESDVSREHEIYARPDGVVIIAGGKLTTYRLMAKQVVRKALDWLSEHDRVDDQPRTPGTKKRPLPGAAGLEDPSSEGVQALAASLTATHDLAPALAEHLAEVYGVRATRIADRIRADRTLAEPLEAGLPYVRAELEFAVSDDLALTVDDVLSRRVPLLLVGRDQGLDQVDRTADVCGRLLGWTAADRAREIARYQKTVADSRRFRSP
ncbi:MAG TPA: glycerol-3-phosphate dehydrogenase [Kofleriaceae bacterium]|nr:glycerol-3-phosphate dehydrogenase [Kofleriaceae bacterium]